MGMTGAQRQEAYRNRNPDRSRKQGRDWSFTPNGTVMVFLNYARDRARKNGIPFELDREWLSEKLIKGTCELTGVKLERSLPTGRYKAHPFSPSIDKKDPSLGYTKENSRLVCFAINRAMSDWGEEILLEIVNNWIKHRSTTWNHHHPLS